MSKPKTWITRQCLPGTTPKTNRLSRGSGDFPPSEADDILILYYHPGGEIEGAITSHRSFCSATSIAQAAEPYPQSRIRRGLVNGGNRSLPSKTLLRTLCIICNLSCSSFEMGDWSEEQDRVWSGTHFIDGDKVYLIGY